MAALSNIVSYLNTLLDISKFQDSCHNGLQVQSEVSEIIKIACAVDAGAEEIRQTIANQAQLLIVHHGLIWSPGIQYVTGPCADKLCLLLKNGCSLYASHLPLDGHLELGNNARIAAMLGLVDIQPFFKLSNSARCSVTIGVKGKLAQPANLHEFAQHAACVLGLKGTASSYRYPLVIDSRKTKISSCAIVSGSGSAALEECARNDIDVLISGEPKHEAFQRARELNTDAIFLGHYRTETWGVKSVAERLEKEFGVGTVFIENDSGI